MTLSTSNAGEQRTCEQHGPYEAVSYLGGRRWSDCPECNRAAALEWKEQEERQKQRDLEERRHGLIRESGIVGRFLGATLDNYVTTTAEQQKLVASCRSFVASYQRDQGGGLWLIGTPGTGKTHLGSAMALDIIRRHTMSARVATAREIVRELRSTWRRDAQEGEEDVLDRFSGYGLLVLDEVGGGYDSDSERAQLFEVIDRRYQLQRPIVVLSNLNLPQLREVLGDRSFDRLREGAQTLVMNWPSYRGGRQA